MIYAVRFNVLDWPEKIVQAETQVKALELFLLDAEEKGHKPPGNTYTHAISIRHLSNEMITE